MATLKQQGDNPLEQQGENPLEQWGENILSRIEQVALADRHKGIETLLPRGPDGGLGETLLELVSEGGRPRQFLEEIALQEEF